MCINWQLSTPRLLAVSLPTCPFLCGMGSPRGYRKLPMWLASPWASRLRVYPFHILSASWAGLEWIRKVLRFSRNLVASELHDAYGVGWLAVIREDELGYPKITAANDSLDSKALLVRLDRAGDLYVEAAAYSLA